jgi:hypothetical protein
LSRFGALGEPTIALSSSNTLSPQLSHPLQPDWHRPPPVNSSSLMTLARSRYDILRARIIGMVSLTIRINRWHHIPFQVRKSTRNLPPRNRQIKNLWLRNRRQTSSMLVGVSESRGSSKRYRLDAIFCKNLKIRT